MSKHTPEALRLADELTTKGKALGCSFERHSTELRRLHAENEDLKTLVRNGIEAVRKDEYEMAKLREVNHELLALLVELIDIEGPQPGTSAWADKARAAIAKATGGDQ